MSTEAREAWLYQLAEHLRPIIAEHGAECPAVRIGVGFTSGGIRGRSIGECWAPEATADQTHAIFLRPNEDDGPNVAATLLHEMIHAAVGIDAKHGPKFRAVAVACGLEGKMTATHAGPDLAARLHTLCEQLGPYPHAALTGGATTAKPKQTTRMVKIECPECGYVCRTTRKWLDEAGAPICPTDHEPMTEGN